MTTPPNENLISFPQPVETVEFLTTDWALVAPGAVPYPGGVTIQSSAGPLMLVKVFRVSRDGQPVGIRIQPVEATELPTVGKAPLIVPATSMP